MQDKTITTCPHTAAYRYTWPGRDEAFICTEHVGHLQAVADAIGLPLQVILLSQPQEWPFSMKYWGSKHDYTNDTGLRK